MTSEPISTSHPVLRFAHQLTDRLSQAAAAPVWSMSPSEQRDALRALVRAEAQLAALRLRVLAEAERCGAGDERGAASAADWVAVATRQTRISARSDLHLARGLEDKPLLSGALDQGVANIAQARVIVTALDRLPASGEFAVTPEQRDRAEAHLVELARHHDANARAVLGRRLFEVIAPALAEAYDGKFLSDQEATAARKTTLRLREDTDGTCHGRF